MFDEIRKDWSIIRSAPPGRRFEERYRYRSEASPISPAGRVLRIAAGASLVLLGVILWFLPGPGWLTIFLGLGVVAGRSRSLSRFLDGAELRLRKVLSRGKRADSGKER